MSKVIFDKEVGCIKTERDDYTFIESFISVVGHVSKEKASERMSEMSAFELTEEWLRDEGVLVIDELKNRVRLFKVGEHEWTVFSYSDEELDRLVRAINMLIR